MYAVMMGGFTATTPTHYAGNRAISFDYWQSEPDANELSIEFRSRQKQMNYSFQVNPVVHKTWTHVEANFADFRANKGRHEPPGDGDEVIRLLIKSGRVGGRPFYVDNIRITERPVPSSSLR
jgi:hypothetical protein